MQACLYRTDGDTEDHTRPQSWLWLSQDRDMTYLVSSLRHFPLESTARADLASLGSPREGGADLSCWIRSSPSLMTLSVASRVAVCCCWNCLISSWTASTESAQTSSSISFCRSSIHVHNCGERAETPLRADRRGQGWGKGKGKKFRLGPRNLPSPRQCNVRLSSSAHLGVVLCFYIKIHYPSLLSLPH